MTTETFNLLTGIGFMLTVFYICQIYPVYLKLTYVPHRYLDVYERCEWIRTPYTSKLQLWWNLVPVLPVVLWLGRVILLELSRDLCLCVWDACVKVRTSYKKIGQ